MIERIIDFALRQRVLVLVERATHTVTKALQEGLILVMLVVALFLGNFRSSLSSRCRCRSRSSSRSC